MNELVEISPDYLPTQVEESARKYATNRHARNTLRAYVSDIAIFAEWCSTRNIRAFPAEPRILAGFLADQADRGVSASTLKRRLAAIRAVHRAYNLNDPTSAEIVRGQLTGIRNAKGSAAHPKDALVAEQIRTIARHLSKEPGLTAIRDKALILLGFAAALRRSELVDLKVNDLEFGTDGLTITIRRSKTDQGGQGQTVAVRPGIGETCPLEALKAWLSHLPGPSGPIFRRIRKGGRLAEPLAAGSVAAIVKARAAECGIDADNLAGHSLRSGALTTGARLGANQWQLRQLSRHRSTQSLDSYVRAVDAFENHPLKGAL